MIARIELNDFLSHKHTVIEPGQTTAIIGDNGSGKSNIWLGVNAVLTNDDFPDTWVRRGCKKGSVKVTFDDGRSIERIRDGASQRIVMIDAEGKELAFNTVRDSTATVREFTKFPSLSLDSKLSQNIQLVPLGENPYFMLTDVAPETLLRRFTRLMAGGGIEDAKATIEADLRAIKSKVAATTETLSNLKNQPRPSAEKLDTLKKAIEKAQRIEQHIAALLKDREDLAHAIHAIERHKNSVQDLERKVKRYTEVVLTVEDALRDYEETLDAINTVEKARDTVCTLTETIAQYTKEIEEITKMEEEVSKKICPTCGRVLY